VAPVRDEIRQTPRRSRSPKRPSRNSASLTRDGALPLYRQVEDLLRQRITSGEWPEDYKLKPEAELAQELGIARGTLRQAISALTADELLSQTRGRGTFVTGRRTDLPVQQRLITIHELLAESGQAYTTELLLKECAPGPARVRSLLDVGADEELLRLRRRLLLEGKPFVALDNWVRLALAPGLDECDFSDQPLFAAIENAGLTIGWGQRNFSAVRAGEMAALLGTVPDEPVLYLEQVTYLADERPLEYSDVWVRGDKLRVTTILRR
jgi:DNA-binding GntR family transcriptional regulator